MKFFIFVFVAFIFPRSGDGQLYKSVPLLIDSSALQVVDSSADFSSELKDLFILIIETSSNFQELGAFSDKLCSQYGLKYENLGRIYDSTKDSLIVPYNDEDQMYAGKYLMRRFPSNDVSIEYLSAYRTDITDASFALIAGIFEKENDAFLFANQIFVDCPHMYILKSRIYLGCMH